MLHLSKKTHLFQILPLVSRWFEESDVKFRRLCSTLNETLTDDGLIILLEQIALARAFGWKIADEVALWGAEELLWENNWSGCLQWFWLRKISVSLRKIRVSWFSLRKIRVCVSLRKIRVSVNLRSWIDAGDIYLVNLLFVTLNKLKFCKLARYNL